MVENPDSDLSLLVFLVKEMLSAKQEDFDRKQKERTKGRSRSSSRRLCSQNLGARKVAKWRAVITYRHPTPGTAAISRHPRDFPTSPGLNFGRDPHRASPTAYRQTPRAARPVNSFETGSRLPTPARYRADDDVGWPDGLGLRCRSHVFCVYLCFFVFFWVISGFGLFFHVE